MVNTYVEQLENIISAFVNNIYKEIPPTEEEFLKKSNFTKKSKCDYYAGFR